MLNDLASIFYPRNCVCCHQALSQAEKDCCIICLTDLPRTNFVNYDENSVAKLFWGRIELTFGFSVFHFHKEGKLQALLHALKYKSKTQIGEFLGREMGKDFSGSKWNNSTDLILPIPLHPKKERLRGYNQCDFLARGMSSTAGIPYLSNVIERVTNTSTQTKKSKYERWKNVNSIFEVSNANKILGKNVLLIDDVITTGSTLESCAQTLLQSGAKSVGIAVVASGS